MTTDSPHLMLVIADWSMARGAKSIKDLPGCWESAIDEHWWLAINGHKTPTRCSRGAEVPPFSAWLEFNGWPAGVVDGAGWCVAAGSIANESALRAALGGPPA